LAKEQSACAIIDERIAIDCPDAKTYLNGGADLKKLKTLCVTHFHADHDFGVPSLMLARGNKPIDIIAPKGCEKRYREMAKLSNFPIKSELHPMLYAKNNARFITSDNDNIQSYKMNHANLDAYGYTISDKHDITAGFTGDTTRCKNVDEIIKKSDIAFMDCTGDGKVHMGIEEFFDLRETYRGKGKLLVPTHLTKSSRELLDLYGVETPYDGKEYQL